MRVPKGFQRGMRFLRWIAAAPEAEVRAAMAVKPTKAPLCWRCQRGRGLYLCVSCGVSVKNIYRRWKRSMRGGGK